MTYISGKSHLLCHKNGEERATLTLFGDQNTVEAGWAIEAVTAQHHHEIVFGKCQTISIWFRFSKFRPYGEVTAKMDLVFKRVKADGWTVAHAADGHPNTGSSVGDLADTEDPAHWNLDFPSSPNVAGYNAARSFVAVFERSKNLPIFTEEEIDQLRQLMQVLGQLVFDHPLSLKEE